MNAILDKVFKALRNIEAIKNQSDLAEKLGVSRSKLSKVMSGEMKFTNELAAKIATVFPSVNSSYLVDGKGPVLSSKSPDTRHIQTNIVKEHDFGHNYGYGSQLHSHNKKINLFINHDINHEYFESITPTLENNKGWVPYYSNIWELLSQYPSPEAIVNDQQKNFWPMLPLPDDMLRVPHTIAHAIISGPAANNMAPQIMPGARISIKYVVTDFIRWGFAHLVVFKDRSYFCYYLKKSTTPNRWLAKNANPAYDDLEIDTEQVFAVFEVVNVNTSSPGL